MLFVLFINAPARGEVVIVVIVIVIVDDDDDVNDEKGDFDPFLTLPVLIPTDKIIKYVTTIKKRQNPIIIQK